MELGRGGSSGRSSGGRSSSSHSSSSRSFSSRSSSSNSSGRGRSSYSKSTSSQNRASRPLFTPPRPPRSTYHSTPPPRHSHYGGYSNPYRTRPYTSGYRKNNGLVSIFMIIIMLFILIITFKGMNRSDITVSTTNREPLGAEACTESKSWFDDQVGWISSDAKMTKGLKEFYKKTGVQPYVIITDNVNGKGATLNDSEAEQYLQETYDALFDDEGHLIFLFLEYESGTYKGYLYAGNQASSVIDTEAQEIIYDFVDYYYTSNLDDNEFFSTVFEKSAERIMQKTTTGNDILLKTIIVIGIIGGISVIGYLIIRKKKIELQEAEEKRKILETPIEKLNDEELKDKYQ